MSEAAAVPLIELLRSIPLSAKMRIEGYEPNFPSTTSIPAGIYAHEAADHIEILRSALAAAIALTPESPEQVEAALRGKTLNMPRARALFRAFAAEEISIGRAMECVMLWANGEDFKLPTDTAREAASGVRGEKAGG